MNKILKKEGLEETVKNLRNSADGKKLIVLCHGVFDLVHPGHIEHFKQAKNFGDILIVSITSDEFIHKGPGRPFFNQDQRLEFLSNLELIDYVILSNEKSGLQAISLIKPDFYVKGSDYKSFQEDLTGKIGLEEAEVEKYGGKLVFTEGFSSSSTKLINEVFRYENLELRNWVNDFKRKFELTDVNLWIDKLKNVDVKIIGETIIDLYTECKPLSKSSKDPILAFQRLKTTKLLGGVLAIADNCSTWAKSTEVFTGAGIDLKEYKKDMNFPSKYLLRLSETFDRPTIAKHRFVDINSGVRVFEYYNFDPSEYALEFQLDLIKQLDSTLNLNSLILCADYGHGLFTDLIINKLCESKAFLAVNTQSNAGNRGFNTFFKYNRMDLLCLNGAELELTLRKKIVDFKSVVPQIITEKKCSYVIVTLGSQGMLVFDKNGGCHQTPAFATKVTDKVGAGDSVLAIASMLSFLNAPKEIIGLLSSLVAAFEVTQLGHLNSLDINQLKQFVKGVLG